MKKNAIYKLNSYFISLIFFLVIFIPFSISVFKVDNEVSMVEKRKLSKDKNSYTSKLLKEGDKKIAQKFGEESAELIIDYLKGTKKRTIEEATDLIYHLFFLLSSKKISYKDIQKELIKRHNVRRK